MAFALVILQRRLASSTYALLRSLERRRDRLQEMSAGADERERIDERRFDFEAVEDLSEEDRWREEELWETLSVAENREELEKEIHILEGLIEKAKEIIREGSEIKVRQLRDTLNTLNTEHPGAKVLVFTEAKDTLDYLEKRIRSWGFTMNTIHGGMKLEDRVKAESIFKNETQVMVATEAAGEGINLQFCYLMLNYDIPWNPNRLEQRMGRIHRYGQTKEVYVFNLVAEDTREGMVLNRLFEKLEEIRKALGSDKVFDVLSEVLYGRNLSQLLLEAASNSRHIDEILKEIDVRVDEEYISEVKENLGESLATRYIDYTRIKEMADMAREHRLIPEYTEAFFKKAFEVAGGKFRERSDGFLAVESVPFSIRQIADENGFMKSYGTILKKYPKATFDKDVAFRNPDAEFVSFGHPLFESTLEWVQRELSTTLQRGAVFKDPDGRLNGPILFYEGEVKDGKGKTAGKRLFAFYVDTKTGKIESANPALIWDLVPASDARFKSPDIQKVRSSVLGKTIEELESYLHEIQQERDRQADIKERYGVKSLEHLIVRLDGDLIKLQERRSRGENVDLVIRNKEESLRNYQKALEDLQHSIVREKNLTMSTPRFLGALLVVPKKKVGAPMKSDAEIEKIGMQVSMQYEEKEGGTPEDVSAENLGFDIRSTDESGKRRYIEVKARSKTGPVALTQNEWFKAKRFGKDYYLYVVYNASTKPELHIVEDPTRNLEPDERVEIVRYIVEAQNIKKKGVLIEG